MRIIHIIIFSAAIQLNEQYYKEIQLISTHIYVFLMYKYMIFQTW